MRSRGTLREEGELATLEFHRSYPHAIERVWSALTTEEGLRGWMLCSFVQIEPRVGGRIELVSGPPQYRSSGLVLAWEPPHVFEYEWNVAPVPEMPTGERARFRFELKESAGETHLRVVYRHLTLHTARGFLPGVHAFLDRLQAQLDDRPLPDWFARFTELRVHYPEWPGHASDAGK